MICFISGGVRSGKSSFAESYAKEKTICQKVYLATSIPYDDEMKARVNRHKKGRELENWVTIEQPTNLTEIISQLEKEDVVVLDCLTILLSNEMFENGVKIEVVDKVYNDLVVLSKQIGCLVIVSNDIFSNAIEFEDYTEAYIANLGKLHQWLVAISDEAYECVSGVSILRKG